MHGMCLEQVLLMQKATNSICKSGGWLFDLRTKELYWDDEIYKIHCLDKKTAITAELAISFYTKTVQKVIKGAFERLVNQGIPYSLELPFKDSNGSLKWVVTTGHIFIDSMEPKYVYGSFKDITETKQLKLAHKSNAINYKAILDNVNDCIITIDEKGLIISASKSIESVFLYTESELIGQSISSLMPEPYSSKHSQFMKNYQITGDAKIIGFGRELPGKRRNGEIFSMELSISAVILNKKHAYIGIVKDITERKAAEDKVKRLAYFDSNFNVKNYTSFKEITASLIERKNQSTYIFLININKFSKFNLIYGKKIGDTLLVLIINVLSNITGRRGEVFRKVNDEFLVLLDFTAVSIEQHQVEIDKFYKNIFFLIKEKCLNQDINTAVTFRSVHLKLSHDFKKVDDIVYLLEAGLSKAPASEINSYKTVNTIDLQELKREAKILYEINSPDFLSELSIVLQPQYLCEKNVIFCSEVLVRWKSKKLGEVPANTFIKLAEEAGVIAKIGYIVLGKLCEAIKKIYRETNYMPRVAFNVSTKQLIQPCFENKIIEIIDKSDLPYHLFTLEVTESVFVDDFNYVVKKMNRLVKYGFSFSVDDFGTGFSSLSYIKHLPIKELKIDKLFIDEITSSQIEVPIVNSIIQMSHALNLSVVAEGVEHAFQNKYLSEHSCDLIQGYYRSKPLSVEQWIDEIKKSLGSMRLSPKRLRRTEHVEI
jgi:PAS domain S-box-containing protein